jgi:hypothetical protein
MCEEYRDLQYDDFRTLLEAQQVSSEMVGTLVLYSLVYLMSVQDIEWALGFNSYQPLRCDHLNGLFSISWTPSTMLPVEFSDTEAFDFMIYTIETNQLKPIEPSKGNGL